MARTKIFLSSPHLSGKEMPFIEEALAANWVAPGGKNTAELEDKIGIFTGKPDVCALNSGTSGLHLSLLLSGVQIGDEVLCQSFTFVASANVIKYVGALPVFIDSEPETWNMCPELLEAAILDRIKWGRKPKAIMMVHGYGMPSKIEEIKNIAEKYKIQLIEDAADALGSEYRGQKCGTFGDFGVLSFNGNKIITTSGGGAIICKTKEEREKALFLATQARDDAPFYQHSELGFNYRMSNISAGIGSAQMEVLPERILQRRRNNAFYKKLFQNFQGINVFSEPGHDFYSNHWLSAITVDEEITGFSSEDLRLKFLEAEIECRPLWKPLHMQPLFKGAPYYGGNVAEKLFQSGLCLPSGSNLTDADLARIKETVAFFRK